MEEIRSFIAIELPDDLKIWLTQLQDKLKKEGQAPVKWVDPYSIHLTLKFLGNVSVNKIDDITEAIVAATQEACPFHLKVKDLGVFPNSRRVQVVWVGLDGEIDQLNQLQQRIDLNLVPLGYARETRPFVAHLTLARVREYVTLEQRQKLGQLVASTKIETSFSFNVDAINLMRSQLTREGAIYSRIASVSLKSSCK